MTDPGFAEPSRFWQRLAAEHLADLELHGFETVKRRQALRYFTWSWRWGSLQRSHQMRYLLAHSRPWVPARALVTPADLSDASWEGVDWPRRDRWLYVFATRVLWEYARRNDTLGILAYPEPDLGGPLPVRWRGRLVSQDLANSALEATAIAEALGGRRPTSILEVGAGYGRTAYALLTAFPDAVYTIVDIEPALSIARWYLTQLFAGERLRFLAPTDAVALGRGSCDLLVSISSLHEMKPEQVALYLDLFDRIAENGVVYLKQWRRWTNPDDGVTLDFDAYPIPSRWRLVFDRRAPVQTSFRHAAWEIGLRA